MDTQPLDQAVNELGHDLSPAWTLLSADVRKRLHATGPDDLPLLRRDVEKLCDHVDRLHQDAAALLASLDEAVGDPAASPDADPDRNAFERTALRIQRESHELRTDFKDIIKALFMWQDHPDDRLKNPRG